MKNWSRRLINSWHEKCVEDEAILADLNIRVNKAFSQKNKYLKLKHHSELELAFNEGFEKFRAFAATTHTSYNWDYVSPDAVREILDDGGDMNEHKHVKAARKKPTDTTK
ncbi:unnamed protein product [Prunus armeniaca]